ncbi:hypothetical protein QQF64_002896 [Cirrhinus molitorella]|uniref:Uncharacterized protein n=1 Tax=Cirrhinus molitorella TaxID=172907 RepID=A0ABR3MRF8_9TELE
MELERFDAHVNVTDKSDSAYGCVSQRVGVFLAGRCFEAGNLSDLNHPLHHLATTLKRFYRLELKNREEEIRLE